MPKEPYIARVVGQKDPIVLSTRRPRALQQYLKLKEQHGTTNVALIPPKIERDKFIAEQKRLAEIPRRNPKPHA